MPPKPQLGIRGFFKQRPVGAPKPAGPVPRLLRATPAVVAPPNPTTTVSLSEEQRRVVEHVADGGNAVCNAVAGSGKTTVVVAAAAELASRGKKCLLLTYNERLKTELRTKAGSHSANVVAHNFHSAASFFLPATGKDADLDQALSLPPIEPVRFDVVMIDEVQDLKPLFREFVLHLLTANDRKVSMLLVGDVFQVLYAYHGAQSGCFENVGWLTSTGKVVEKPFERFRLSISWRITHEMASFINANLNPCEMRHAIRPTHPEWWDSREPFFRAVWGDGIRASPFRGPAPDSVVEIRERPYFENGCLVKHGCRYDRSIKKWIPKPESRISPLLDAMVEKFGNSGIVLLDSTIRFSTPMTGYVNAKCEAAGDDWLILEGDGETTRIDPRVWDQKRIVSTVHKFKGLERDGVIFFGLDEHFLRRNLNVGKDVELVMAEYNKMYVACTRARKQLAVIIGEFPTINQRALVSCRGGVVAEQKPIPVTELFRHAPFDRGLQVNGVLWQMQSRGGDVVCGSPVPVGRQRRIVPGRGGKTVEDVSPILGSAIGYSLWEVLDTETFDQYLRDVRASVHPNEDRRDDHAANRAVSEAKRAIGEYCETRPSERRWRSRVMLAVAVYTITSSFVHLWFQLDSSYDWVDCVFMETCAKNAIGAMLQIANGAADASALAARTTFEVDLSHTFGSGGGKVAVNGRVDAIIDGHILVEFKVTDAIENHEYACQTASYLSLCLLKEDQPPSPPSAVLLCCNLGAAFDVTLVAGSSRRAGHEFLAKAIKCKTGVDVVALDDDDVAAEMLPELPLPPP